ncbi:MAG: AAA family ATPase, partial [Acholeplasmatales bacterium]|nr:AAA family ATPase [Acholeplasmatales bacterium]
MQREYPKREEKQKRNDSNKAKLLCYSSIYPGRDDETLRKIIRSKNTAYYPFLNYLKLAKQAAETKQSIGASFNLVNRDIDYKLSCWLNIKIISKIMNGVVVTDKDFIEKAIELNMPIEDIIVEKVTVDGKEVKFYQLEDSIVFEADKTARIVINDNPDLLFDRNEFISNTVNYYGSTIICRKQKIAVDKYMGDECTDSTFPFIKYKIHKDSDDQKPDEFTIELIDDPSTEISVFEIFFNEDQNDVFFNPNTKERYKVAYKNKESGRLVIKSPKGIEGIDLNGKVYLNTNTNQLNRQRNAISAIIERPSKYQKVLLNMCERKDKSSLDKFEFYNLDPEYKILTDVNREGTLKQREFVKKAMQTPDFMILQGPPGSGKTTAILELIYQLIKEGKKVLLCASTHVAIDNVLEKIIEHGESSDLLSVINPVRVGDESNVYSDCVRPYIYSKIHETINNSDYDDMVDESFNLVCGTTIGVLSFPLIDKKLNDIVDGKKNLMIQTTIEPIFDYLILDEASKTTFSEFLVPATLCKRWIIVGDVKQLAPYVEKNDLIPSLLQCKPLASKDERFALSFIKLYRNPKDRDKYKDYAFVFNTSAIEYIDSRVEENITIAC